MIRALQNSDQATKQRVLANLTQKFLPQPFDNENIMSNVEVNLYNNTLSEIYRKLRISKDDTSVEATEKILSYLSTEISNLLLTSNRTHEAKVRLSEKGLLNINDYSPIFTENYTNLHEDFGNNDNKIYIQRAIKSGNIRTLKDENDLIYFTYTVEEFQKDPFLLFVIGSLDGVTIQISFSMRLYLSDFSIPEDHTLNKLLMLFLDRFGVDFRINNIKRSRIIYNQVTTELSREYSFEFFDDEVYTYKHLYRLIYNYTYGNRPGYITIRIAFAMDITKYRQYLRKHNVDVDRRS